MDTLFRQLKQTSRKLVRAPLFTVVAVATLGLGIGANTAIFSLVNGILLTPLPFPEPDRLVGLWFTAPGLNFDQVNQAPALHYTMEDEARAFERMGMWTSRRASITGIEEPEEVRAILVTEGTFPALGIRPTLGRRFSAEEDSPGGAPTAILSHGFWQSRFAGDPGVLGRTVRVDGVTREIIGVMPEGMDFMDYEAALYLPFRLDRSELMVGNFSYRGVGRLAPAVTREQAEDEVARLLPVAVERYPGGLTLPMLEEARLAPLFRPLKEDVVGDVGQVLWVLLGTVGMVLLIACANVANLFLVRAEGREREVAVRTAIGAMEGEVMRMVLRQGMILAGVGIALGLAGAFGLTRLMEALLFGISTTDPLTFVVVSASLAVVALLATWFPARRAARTDPVQAIRYE
jgi:predicted permease